MTTQKFAGVAVEEATRIVQTYKHMSKTPFWKDMELKMQLQQAQHDLGVASRRVDNLCAKMERLNA